MSTTATACDLLQDRRVSWLWPAAFIGVGAGWLVVRDPSGALLAAAGFALAGGLCVANALRCRRMHCAITGPLYLLAGLGCWALAYRQQPRARCESDTCGTPASRRTSRALLWGSLFVLVMAAGYPYAIAYFTG